MKTCEDYFLYLLDHVQLVIYSIDILFAFPIHFRNIEVYFVHQPRYIGMNQLLQVQSNFNIDNIAGSFDIICMFLVFVFDVLNSKNFW